MKENRIKNKATKKDAIKWSIFAIALIFFDQLVKFLSRKYLILGKPYWLIEDFAGLELTYNEGAAWSLGSDYTWLLSIISVLACIGIAIYFTLGKINRGERSGLAFLFAGALANGIDRIFMGKVTDMLYANIFLPFGEVFPIFNVADLLVTIGAIIVIFNWIFRDKEE